MRHTRNDIVKMYLYSYFEKNNRNWEKILVKENPFAFARMVEKRIIYIIPGENGLFVQVWDNDENRTIAENNTVPIFEQTIPYSSIWMDGTYEINIEYIDSNGKKEQSKLKNLFCLNRSKK